MVNDAAQYFARYIHDNWSRYLAREQNSSSVNIVLIFISTLDRICYISSGSRLAAVLPWSSSSLISVINAASTTSSTTTNHATTANTNEIISNNNNTNTLISSTSSGRTTGIQHDDELEASSSDHFIINYNHHHFNKRHSNNNNHRNSSSNYRISINSNNHIIQYPNMIVIHKSNIMDRLYFPIPSIMPTITTIATTTTIVIATTTTTTTTTMYQHGHPRIPIPPCVAVLLLLQLLRRHHPCRLVRVESEGHCSVILIKYWIGRHY